MQRKTEKTIVLEIARIIKKKRKEFNELNIIPIYLNIKYFDNKTFIKVDDGIEYYINSIVNDNDIIEASIKQSGCNCEYKNEDNKYSIYIYQKPIKEFNRLNCLLKKLSLKELKWNDVYTRYKGLEGYLTDYLCYNQFHCLQAINFIKDNNSLNKTLKIDLIQNDNMKYLEMIIIDENGYKTTEKVFG